MAMVTQSRCPVIVLTRPAPQSQRFARDLAERLKDVRIVISPLMAPVFHCPTIPAIPYQGVILTSETGVQAAKGLDLDLPPAAYCVGERTAADARRAGFVVQITAPDAVGLAGRIAAARPAGPLLHLRGRDSAGELAKTVTNSGTETHEAIVYTQVAQPLDPQALGILGQSDPVIVPIFSPRSAGLLIAAAPKPLNAPLWIVAISRAAAEAAQGLEPARLVIAAHPDSENMLHAVTGLVISACKA